MTKVLSFLIYGLVRFFYLTYRFRFVGMENLKKAKELSPSKGYLLGIWHQNLFQGILAQTGLKYVVIVSRSKDAEPVAFTCRNFGHIVKRGSSRNKAGVDKGGKAAMEEMVDVLKEGIPGAVTVDGPKGPAREVKPGIIAMAKKSGTVLVPYLPIAQSYWSFNSWDKFRLPKPFSKIIVYYGEPIQIGEEDFSIYQEALKKPLDENEAIVLELFSNWKQLSKKNFL